jgi:hypothetical protein
VGAIVIFCRALPTPSRAAYFGPVFATGQMAANIKSAALSTKSMPGFTWKHMPLFSAVSYSVISIAITLINKVVLTSYGAYVGVACGCLLSGFFCARPRGPRALTTTAFFPSPPRRVFLRDDPHAAAGRAHLGVPGGDAALRVHRVRPVELADIEKGAFRRAPTARYARPSPSRARPLHNPALASPPPPPPPCRWRRFPLCSSPTL